MDRTAKIARTQCMTAKTTCPETQPPDLSHPSQVKIRYTSKTRTRPQPKKTPHAMIFSSISCLMNAAYWLRREKQKQKSKQQEEREQNTLQMMKTKASGNRNHVHKRTERNRQKGKDKDEEDKRRTSARTDPIKRPITVQDLHDDPRVPD